MKLIEIFIGILATKSYQIKLKENKNFHLKQQMKVIFLNQIGD
jgi:hypothetical protein